MRQTNNALTFLSSSYQAVFKHAYTAGLASSAVMLSLASPYALASVNADWDDTPNNNATVDHDSQLLLSRANNERVTVPIRSGDVFTVDANSATKQYYSRNYFNQLNVESGSLDLGSSFYYDTGFYAKDQITITNSNMNVIGRGDYYQEIRGSADESGAITGNLAVTGSALNVTNAVVTVNNATISGSTIDIGKSFTFERHDLGTGKVVEETINAGLIKKNGQTTSDVAANYSSLNVGMGEGGATTITDSNLNIGNYAALNALGSLTVNGGSVNFSGEKDNAVQHALGEIAAKSFVSVASGSFNDTKIDVTADKTGAFFGQDLSINGTAAGSANITVGSGGVLQFAGQFTNTNAAGETIQTGYSGTGNVNTTFSSGTLNLNGSTNLTNAGTVTFGANSVSVDAASGTVQSTASNFTVNQNSGTITNASGAVLNIGEALAAGVSLDITQGTTFNLNGGVSNNSGTFNVNAGANYNVNGGTFNNAASGNVSVNSGAAFTLASGSVNNAATFAVNTGADLNINGGTFTNTTTGQINNAGNFAVNSGASFNLSGGTFTNNAAGVVNVNSGASVTLAAAADGSTAGSLSNLSGSQFNVNDGSNLTLSSGSLNNTGTIAFNSGANFNVQGGVFTNSGTGIVNVNSGSHVNLAAAADGTTAGTINNQSGALFNVNDGSDLTITSGSLSNAGTIAFNSGSTFNVQGGVFNNSGTGVVNVNSGSHVTLAAAADGTTVGSINNQSGAQFNVNSGSDLTINSGSFSNAGTVAFNSGASLNINDGTFTNADTGVVNVNESSVTLASGSLANAGQFNLNSGSTYNQTSGTLANAGQFNLNSGTNAKVTGGVFQNFDTVNVGSGASLVFSGTAVLDGNPTNPNTSQINIASGGSLSMSSGVLSGHSGEAYYYDGKTYQSANLSSLGNINNSGSVNLTDGLFVADGSDSGSMGEKFSQALSGVSDTGLGQIYFNDAILMLESGSSIDTSSAKLATSKIGGNGNTTLYSQGDIRFAAKTDGTGEQVNNFTKIVANNLTFANESGSGTVNPNDPITLKSVINNPETDQKVSFTANTSVNTVNDADLVLDNANLILSSELMLKNVTAVPLEVTDNSQIKQLNANVNLTSGSTLAVEAGTWQGQNINAQDSVLEVKGSAVGYDGNPFDTGAQLQANNLALTNSLGSIEQAALSVSGSMDVLGSGGNTSEVVATDSALSLGELNINQGHLTATNSTQMDMDSATVTDGTLTVDNATSEQTTPLQVNIAGNLSVLGSALASVHNADLAVNEVNINTDSLTDVSGGFLGLTMINANFESKGDVSVNNGALTSTNLNPLSTDGTPAELRDFNVNGELSLAGNAFVQLDAVKGRVDLISVADSGSKFNLNNSELRTEGLVSAGQVNLTNSDLNNYGTIENSGQFTAASGSNLQNHGNIYNSGSMSLDGSNLQSFGDLISEGQLTASNGSELRVNGNVELGGNPSVSGGLALSGSSSLETNDITLADNATLSTDSSKITADTIVSTGSGSMSFTNGSTVNIKGDSDHSTVDFAGDITLSASYLNLGDALDSLAMTYDKTNGLQIGGDGTYNPIKADSGSIIYVNLSGVPGSQGLTLSQLSNFVDKLMSGNGIVRFDGTINPQLAANYNPDLKRWEIDHDDLSKFGDFNFNFSTDETRKSVLVNASGTLAGEWFGIETDSGVTSFNVDKTLTILGQANAGTHSGDELNIAQDSGGNVVGVTLGSGSALNLQANGNIGNIIDENLSATLNISNATQINIKPIGDATRSQLKVGTLISSAMINVQDVNVNTATFSGGGLTSDLVNVSGSLTANNADFIAQTSFTANGTNANGSTFTTTTLSTGEFTGAGNKLIADTITTGNFSGSANQIQATDLTTGNFIGDGNTITANNFTADSLSGEANAIYVDNINVGSANLSKSQVEATTISLSGAGTFADTDIKASNFTGADLSLNSGSTMELSGDITATGQVNVIGDSSLKAQNMTLGSGDMYVGEEGNTNNPSGSSAEVSLATLNLNGNDLFLDPEFGQKTATMFVNNIGAAEHTASGSTVLNGNIVVGRNSALGLGSDEQDFHKELAKLQDATTQSLKSDGIGAYLYIDRTNIQLGDNKLIVGTEDLATLKEQLANGTARIYLGQQSGMQVTANALSSAQSGNGLIFSDLDNTDVIESKDGTLILPSFATAQDIGDIFGDQVQLASGSTIKVQTSNGLISGEINDSNDLHGSGDLVLDVDDNARDILHDVSDPTFNYYMNVLAQQSGANQGNQGNTSGSTVSDPTDTDSDVDTSGSGSTTTPETEVAMLASAATANTGTNETPRVQQSGAGYDFLSQAGGEGTGRAIEQSARLASFGMGVQIANQAAKTTSDAIGRRLSMHVNNSAVQDATVLTNNVSSVWVSPTYQNYSSSKFNADNLNYGADVDMYGMVAGADYAVANGVKVGAAVNIGKGDASGKGIAAGVKNDFKYYGAGLYASVQPAKNLTLSADASYTFVQSDMETDANVTGYNKITGSADSSAISAGVNAMYRFKAFGIDVAPHVGVRYNHIALDGYDFKADGTTIGHTDTDSADVLSLPFGVALSTEVVTANNWILKPNADFTVTANIGGDSIGSESTFDGAVGSAKYNTEFMDSFHYGVDAGLTIQKGNFSVGANVGFNGSHNTSELTVDANAQYKF